MEEHYFVEFKTEFAASAGINMKKAHTEKGIKAMHSTESVFSIVAMHCKCIISFVAAMVAVAYLVHAIGWQNHK